MEQIINMDIKQIIREIPDFPKEGINFKDVTTLFNHPEAFSFVVDSISTHFKEKNISKVIGLLADGFVFGCAIFKF